MGVSIYCQKTGTSYDMGYGGFNRLRLKVAELTDEEFYKLYEELETTPAIPLDSPESEEFYNDWNKRFKSLIDSKKGLSLDVVDFLMRTDCEGKISRRACRKIYNIVKDYDNNVCYGYCGRDDCFMFRDFVSLLKECIKTKSEMVWW